MRILVPTAGPTPARRNADYIINLAKKLGADVAVVHILDLGEYDDGRQALDIFDEVGKTAGVHVDTYIKEGNVIPTIVDLATDLDVDLIVMGASEGRIVAEWIVTSVLERVDIPIVIIPYGFDRAIPDAL